MKKKIIFKFKKVIKIKLNLQKAYKKLIQRMNKIITI